MTFQPVKMSDVSRQVDARELPYIAYEHKGYSAKHLVTTIFAGITAMVLSITLAVVVLKMMWALDESVLEQAATFFLFGLISLILCAGGLFLIVMFRAIIKPGQQLPGFLGKFEPKDGV
jgi:uncharacterized protein YacL